MNTVTAKEKEGKVKSNAKVGELFGKMFSFNNSLKLFHWHVTGKGSYAQHMALDQAIESLLGATDRIVETSYAMLGDISITIPETPTPDNIIKHCEICYEMVEDGRKLLPEDFSQSILDDYHEAIQQLLYRLKRLQ